MEHLASLAWYLNYIVGQTDFTSITPYKVNFHWGNLYELSRYLSVDQDDNYGKILMSGTIESSYPLIWLAKGYSFYAKDQTEQAYVFEDIKVLIFKDTDKEWLNKQRWKDNMHKLYGIGGLFKDKLKSDHNSDVISSDFKWVEDDNISVEKLSGDSSKGLDYCDALVLKIRKIELDTNCFKYLDNAC